MALKSTIHKIRLTLSNINIHHYQDYSLTLAKHPSETDERMMIRLLAYALSAHEEIQFTKGISDDTEPDLWKLNYDGSVEHWIELGLPDERHIRQICSKAKKVTIYTYHGNQAAKWYESIENSSNRFEHLSIVHFRVLGELPIEVLSDKGMNLDISIQDNELWIANEKERIGVEFKFEKTNTL
ncbi:MAG: YaeQ family protein [Bacteriovoracaceae bacterium]